MEAEAWLAFQERFQAHVAQYGHIIYDLDFARPLPVDDPTPMLETVKMYLRDLGVNPHERQRVAVDMAGDGLRQAGVYSRGSRKLLPW